MTASFWGPWVFLFTGVYAEARITPRTRRGDRAAYISSGYHVEKEKEEKENNSDS